MRRRRRRITSAIRVPSTVSLVDFVAKVERALHVK
jgi:methenyltetrahydromethanopterin cyclohydrolase